MYKRQVIYENFVERRAKVMIFDSAFGAGSAKRASTLHTMTWQKKNRKTNKQRGS